jgi:hypothetical protein
MAMAQISTRNEIPVNSLLKEGCDLLLKRRKGHTSPGHGGYIVSAANWLFLKRSSGVF